MNVKNHLSLFVTTGAAGIALAYVLFCFVPGQQTIADLRESLQQKQHYVLESTKLVSVINDLERELDECHSFVNGWRAQAPSGSKLANLMGDITNQAEQAKVQIVSLLPAQTVQHAMLREMPFSIKVEGSFHAVADFLRRMESLPASIWFPIVNLKPAGEDGQDICCELTLSIFIDASDIDD